MRLLPKLVVSAALLAVGGCITVLPAVTPEQLQRFQAQAPTVTQASLDSGRALYLNRCGTCHRLYAPTRYEPELWPVMVGRMQERAHLAPEQRSLISQYLQATSAR